MDAVIGIALTATTAGVTLASGDVAPHLAVDGVTVSLDEGRSSRAQLAAAVRRIYAQGAKRGCRARTVAVTWTADADDHAVGFSGLPAELDVDLLPVPLASAGSALVSDTGSTDTVVCVLEPDVERGLRGAPLSRVPTSRGPSSRRDSMTTTRPAGWPASSVGSIANLNGSSSSAPTSTRIPLPRNCRTTFEWTRRPNRSWHSRMVPRWPRLATALTELPTGPAPNALPGSRHG